MMHPKHTLLALALALVPLAALAGGETTPHPMIDFSRLKHAEPLEQTATPELEERRAAYATALAGTRRTDADAAALERELLAALLHYDAERIRLVDMIPCMIETYAVDAELGDDMLNFQKTMRGVIDELRHEATTLQRYKPYDFRIGMGYLALMSMLNEHEQLRARMQADQQDAGTMLGRHRAVLSARYAGVEEVRGRLEAAHRRTDLAEEIARIDAELRRRRSLAVRPRSRLRSRKPPARRGGA